MTIKKFIKKNHAYLKTQNLSKLAENGSNINKVIFDVAIFIKVIFSVVVVDFAVIIIIIILQLKILVVCTWPDLPPHPS